MELAELIYERCNANTQSEWIADVLGRLVWLTADNGAEIRATLHRWLREGNEAQAAIALAFDEAWLWEGADEMNRLLRPLAERLPSLAARCADRCAAWRRQFGGR